MANPANVALFGYNQQLWLKMNTTGSTITADRIQSVEPTFTFATESYFELGRKGKIGITQAPPEFTINVTQNLTDNMEMEYLLSGQNPNPAIAQTVNMGQLITQAGNFTGYVLSRNQDGTILDEQVYNGISAVELTYNFVINGAMTQNFRLIGTSGSLLPAAQVVHSSWGTLDDTSFGGINGKDARIWFTSGSTATSRAYRLQSFTIRATFPYQYRLDHFDFVGDVAW